MRRARPFRSITSLGLLAFLGTLSTGLPSHHHGDPADDGGGARLVSADHHSHGTRLVDQDERAPSTTPQAASATVVRLSLPIPLPSSAPSPASAPLRPMERAPPPGAPRAPPRPS